MHEHNIGHSGFTSLGIPWILVYTEHFETVQDAIKREMYIKFKKLKQVLGVVKIDSKKAFITSIKICVLHLIFQFKNQFLFCSNING